MTRAGHLERARVHLGRAVRALEAARLPLEDAGRTGAELHDLELTRALVEQLRARVERKADRADRDGTGA